MAHPYGKLQKLYKIRRNFAEFWGLMIANAPENNRVSKEKR
jgi:hypothetical protein